MENIPIGYVKAINVIWFHRYILEPLETTRTMGHGQHLKCIHVALMLAQRLAYSEEGSRHAWTT